MPEITIKDLRQRHIEDFLRERRNIANDSAGLDADKFAAALVAFAREAAKSLDGTDFASAMSEYVRGLTAIHEQRDTLTAIEEDGVRVRAAARCGWFDGLDEGDVPGLEPWRVDQLSTEIAERFNEARTAPKN